MNLAAPLGILSILLLKIIYVMNTKNRLEQRTLGFGSAKRGHKAQVGQSH